MLAEDQMVVFNDRYSTMSSALVVTEAESLNQPNRSVHADVRTLLIYIKTAFKILNATLTHCMVYIRWVFYEIAPEHREMRIDYWT